MGKIAFLIIALVSHGSLAATGNFLWGAANSSFQVEGAPAPSDWSVWTHTPGRIADQTNADRATDFWNRYQEDFTLAKNSGMNAFRISLAWERIEPAPHQWDQGALNHYREMIQAMRKTGLEPVVTIFHFTIPKWLSDKGGILAKEFPEAFAEYSRVCVQAFADSPTNVKYWLTINEPDTLLSQGFFEGTWPPGLRWNLKATVEAEANLIRAHLFAAREIRKLQKPDVLISIAKVWTMVEPANPSNPIDLWMVNIVQNIQSFQMMDALMTGHLRLGLWGFTPTINEDIPLPEGKPSLDYVGINYYSRVVVGIELLWGPPQPEYPRTDLGWEIYPHGLYESVKQVSGDWNLPVLVTENGLADKADAQRPEFITRHLGELSKAISEGAPVLGYLHWSLTDNFEWASGLSPRFGLVEIDYAKNLQRIPRPSLQVYKNWIEQHPHGL